MFTLSANYTFTSPIQNSEANISGLLFTFIK